MNSRPMILRFSSGSVTPASASRKRSWASTTCRSTPVAATKSRSTCSASPWRSSPWSTKTQVSRSPIGALDEGRGDRGVDAAGEAADGAARRRSGARIRSSCSSTMLTIVQVGRQPAMSCRKCSSTVWPCSVCMHLGVPLHAGEAALDVLEGGHRRARRSRRRTVKPAGAPTTESPWLIQTLWPRAPRPAACRLLEHATGVRPYSERPVRATSPPRAWAMTWKP